MHGVEASGGECGVTHRDGHRVRALAAGIVALLLMVSAACAGSDTPSVREITATNGTVTLPVRVAGNPASGNVLIAIHGGPGMTSDYLLNLEILAGSDLAVVTYDQRGVGRSSNPPADPGSYTLQKYAEDLDAVREALGVDSVHVFGHSWGGIVALRYASLHPDRVRSVVLMGSGPPTYAQTRQCQDAIVRRIVELTKQGLITQNPKPGSREAERGALPAYFSDPTFWFSADDPGGAPLIDERTVRVGNLTWTANAGYDLTARPLRAAPPRAEPVGRRRSCSDRSPAQRSQPHCPMPH